MTEVTIPEGVRTGACVVRAEVDGHTGLRITVTERVDVEDQSGERRTVTTSVAAALARVSEFLEACARDGGQPPRRSAVRPPPVT
jgi:hypothetical protein